MIFQQREKVLYFSCGEIVETSDVMSYLNKGIT